MAPPVSMAFYGGKAEHTCAHVLGLLPAVNLMFMGSAHADGDTWREAYGRVLGTVMLASLLEIFLSFVPPRTLKRLFPPIVTGTAVFLIGASLVGTGVKCA